MKKNNRLKFNLKYLNSKDNLFAILLSVMLCRYTLFDYIRVIISKLPVINRFECLFFPVVYILLFVLSYKKERIKKIRLTDLLILLFFIFEISLTYIFYPENSLYIRRDLFKNIIPCIPFFLIGLTICLNIKTLNIVRYCSLLAILVTVLYLIFYIKTGRALGGSHGENYSMYSSYILLPNTLITIDWSLCTKNIKIKLFALLGIIYAFMMGTRGPIVIIFGFVIIYILLRAKVRTRIKVYILAFTLILILKLTNLFNIFLNILAEILERYNLSTRVLDFLIKGKMISHTSGRTLIYSRLIELLKAKPLLGYGIYGEYPFGYLAGAHNVYLQVIFNFGCIIGLILILGYTYVFIRALKKSRYSSYCGWVLSFGCLVYVRGIFGGAYLDYTVFFLLGLCLQIIRRKNVKRIKKSFYYL